MKWKIACGVCSARFVVATRAEGEGVLRHLREHAPLPVEVSDESIVNLILKKAS